MFWFWACNVHALSVILVWSSIMSSFLIPITSSTHESDRLALLAFKHQISNDPLGALNSWNDSLHYCEWLGVTCSRRHPDRVSVLHLESQKLEGTLPPYIGNLTFLRKIILTMNKFHGPIPQEIGHLFRLEILSLNNNSFSGEIPTNLTHCSNLQRLNLIDNDLSGGIPAELTTLSKLTHLGLAKNELKGSIPPSIGNLSSLATLSLTTCSLEGTIPNDLCRLGNLQFFQISSNNLTGMVPSCLYNHSNIAYFSIYDNKLEGSLPPDIGLTLPNILELHVGGNKFSGVIPLSLSNASRLQAIELHTNQFTGQVPGDLGRLYGLWYLSLYSNQLGSMSGNDLGFVNSLTNCSNLQWLEIFNNSFKGPMPNSIANLSSNLISLQLGINQIFGSISSGIENLVNLEVLELEDNQLTGEIPPVIGMLPKMQKLYLARNQFSGEIPDSFGNSSSLLTILDLSGNKLHGRIPPNLGNNQNLFQLDLKDNMLNGTIPKQVIGLSSLRIYLDLSNNSLSGPLPSQVGNLTSLVALSVSNNNLSGFIPDALGNCLSLQSLLMAHNSFEGDIPKSLSTLKGLIELDLSHNELSGEIPKYLGNFTSLTDLNLSYNKFVGSVPKDGVFANASVISADGNSKLCGGAVELRLSPCHIHKKGKSVSLKIIIPVILVSAFVVLLACVLFVCYRRRMSKAKPSAPLLFNDQYTRVSYAELLKATNGFSSDNLIGMGSYGSVYKGVLPQDGTIVAVKVFNLQKRGASKSFLSECNALRNLRHRNLLKIITSCSSVDFQGNDFKALVFQFMPNGNLEEWIHPKRNEHHELRNLSFIQKLNIVIDVASALEYLHHHCQPTIVHCDLKPSNVLLDDDMTAHVADFGLAKIFSDSSQSQESSFAVKGSIGYVAPEYGIGDEVSMQGDVYSYGILLLEVFTGKRPTNDMFQDGRNLQNFAKSALPEVMSIVDPKMLLDDCEINISNQSDRKARMQKCSVSTIRLGVACSAESPNQRMNMGEVVAELYHIKDHYQGVRIHLE